MISLQIGKWTLVFYFLVLLCTTYLNLAVLTKDFNLFNVNINVVLSLFVAPFLITVCFGVLIFRLSFYYMHKKNINFYETSAIEVNASRKLILKNKNQSIELSSQNYLNKKFDKHFYLLHSASTIPIIIPRNGLPRQIDDALEALVLAKT